MELEKTTSPTIPRTQTSAIQIATDITAMVKVLAKFGAKTVKYFRFKIFRENPSYGFIILIDK